jgi:hypothetical protein
MAMAGAWEKTRQMGTRQRTTGCSVAWRKWNKDEKRGQLATAGQASAGGGEEREKWLSTALAIVAIVVVDVVDVERSTLVQNESRAQNSRTMTVVRAGCCTCGNLDNEVTMVHGRRVSARVIVLVLNKRLGK